MSREKFEADFTAAKEKARKKLENEYVDEAKEMNEERDQLKAEVSAVEEKKKRLAEIEGQPAQKEKSAEIKEKVKNWEDFLKKHFSEKQFNLSEIEIPERTPEQEKEFTRLQFRTSKLDLFKKCQELFPLVNSTSKDLDEIIKNSDVENSFIWVRDNEAADEEHKNKSLNMVEKEKLDIETIGDRVLHELKYFDETGDHLDKQTGTLTSSRDSVGGVLGAYWRVGKFRVDWPYPDNRSDGWHVRQAVSSPTKSEK